ncbi:fimbria/pilus outer membrane usher protein [Escherichia coli]
MTSSTAALLLLDIASRKKLYDHERDLDASDSGMVRTGNDKEMYTATYNQNFRDAGVSVYLNDTRHTYWDREEQTNYNIRTLPLFQYGQHS